MNRIRQGIGKLRGKLRGRLWAGPWLPPEQGRMPYFWLLSLGYMFWKYAYVPPSAFEAAMLVLTFVVFIPLYFASYWARGGQVLACMLAGCLIGTAWVHWNAGAGTFFIFALRVADDGERLWDGAVLRPGNGLAGMQERVVALGGKLDLRAGAGLALELRVPA